MAHPHALPESAARRAWGLVSVVSAALVGCLNPEYVSENPVENQVPPLKAGVYRIEAVDVRPVSTREVEPNYPIGLASIMTGKAVVVFTVRKDGRVADAAVVEADDTLFGEAAVSAVRKWRFRPAEVKGVPVDCRMTLPFVFSSQYGYRSDGESAPDPSGVPPDGSHQTTIEPR
jgi:TonB family protein